MALSSNGRALIKNLFNQWALAEANAKAVPAIQQDIRIDTGEMSRNTRAELRREGNKEVVQIVADTDYSYVVELKYGLFKDGSTLAGTKEEYVKKMLD